MPSTVCVVWIQFLQFIEDKCLVFCPLGLGQRKQTKPSLATVAKTSTGRICIHCSQGEVWSNSNINFYHAIAHWGSYAISFSGLLIMSFSCAMILNYPLAIHVDSLRTQGLAAWANRPNLLRMIFTLLKICEN